jgi:hypothetical protein
MRLILLLLSAAILGAQGVPAEWNVRPQLDDLRAKFEAIPPQLAKVDLNRWKQEGVAVAYLSQYEGMVSQLKSLSLAIGELRQTPEKLAVALEIYLRFDALDAMQRSLMEAVRKYEPEATAAAIEESFVASAPGRNQFRTYVLDLASLRDKEYEVLQTEAQRCRVERNMPQLPPRPAAAPGKKK